MKFALPSLLLLVQWYSVNAQITGVVSDQSDNPLPFATVALYVASDSSMFGGAVTDLDGTFRIEGVASNDYYIKISSVGFKDYYSDNFRIPIESAYHLGKVQMAEQFLTLDGVTVQAQRMQVEQSMEGSIINVQNSIMSKGSSALQVLERSPGVILDQRNSTLSLNGQSGTLIMINGKPVRMSPAETISFLRGLSADNIEKVELLTNPSAKYDADGTAGIINIVMNKMSDEGTNGSFSASLGHGWGSKQAASISLNHRKRNINSYLNYSLSNDNSFTDFHAVGQNNLPIQGGDVQFDFRNESELTTMSHNFLSGLDADISQTITIGASVNYNYSNARATIFNRGEYLFPSNFIATDINLTGSSKWNNFTNSVFLDKKLANGSLSVNADYLIFKNNAPNQSRSQYFNGENVSFVPTNELYPLGSRGANETEIDIVVAKVDYQSELNNRISIETGVKGTLSRSSNSATIEELSEGIWEFNGLNDTELTIKENIGAVYISTNVLLDSGFTLQVGARYEHWDQDFGDPTLNRSFGKLFPSIFLNRQVSKTTNLNLAYNRRITRPTYNDLASFVVYNDPVSVFSGNPLLIPAISDNLTLSANISGFNFSMSYINEDNPITRFQITDNGDLGEQYVIAPQNLGFQRSWMLNTNLPFQPSEWWNINGGGSVGLRSFKLLHTVEELTKRYFTFNSYLNQTFNLPKGFSAEVSTFYLWDFYNGNTRMRGFGAVNFGLKKQLKNNRGSFQVAITDAFKTMDIIQYFGAVIPEVHNNTARVIYQPESANTRIFRFTYSRSFGNQKVKSRSNRKSGSQEENNRVRIGS